MAVKLLENLIHSGISYKIGSVVSGIESDICENIVSRGLAVETNEEPTHVITEAGVNVKENSQPSKPVAAEDALKSQHAVNNTDEATAKADSESSEKQAAQNTNQPSAAGVAPTVKPTHADIAADVANIK